MFLQKELTPNRITARVLTPNGYSDKVTAFYTGEMTSLGTGYYETADGDRLFILKYEWDDEPTLVEVY